jgi:FAD/FMN-containing dehydrogenase
VGDSNLHVTTDGASIGQQGEVLEQLLYELVARFQGSISAEHGIGLHKKAYLAASRTPQELATMRAIKQALDPLNLLNPGKIFGL